MKTLTITLLVVGVVLGAAGVVTATGWALMGDPSSMWLMMAGQHDAGMSGGMMGRCHMGGCTAGSGAAGSGTPPAGIRVDMTSSQFNPAQLTVHVGDTVVWVNHDPFAHTVTSDAGNALDSPWIQPGEWWSHTFTQAGTYAYHCTPHAGQASDGSWEGMTATVVVEP